jgi:hypothetical protein
MLDFSTRSYPISAKLALFLQFATLLRPCLISGEFYPKLGKGEKMATIVVKDSNGRPVVNAQVTANTVVKYAWGDYNLAGKTDENGVCELIDRNERYRLSIEGIGVKTVDKLRNVIHLLSPG